MVHQPGNGGLVLELLKTVNRRCCFHLEMIYEPPHEKTKTHMRNNGAKQKREGSFILL